MKTLLFAILLALSLATAPANARQPQEAALTQYAEPNESGLVEHKHYVNSSGRTVHSPAHSISGSAPAGATAKCRDDSYSFSQHHQGTCSHHGGVNQWL